MKRHRTGTARRNPAWAGTAALLALAAAGPAAADEGMWTLDNVPVGAIEKAYGFRPDTAWLERVQLGSVRLAGGCSASFASPQGLILTNHHCITSCLSELSTAENDLLLKGFLAKTRTEERQCAGIEANQLLAITDVTATVNAATDGKTGAAFEAARRAASSELEKACAGEDPTLRCDLVTLYQGGRYNLYKYKRYQDVRLAFAPELKAAFFGGDPDNFNFPRYAMDMALVRAYDREGKPAATPNFFKWDRNGTKAGDLVFTSGHPGSTSRLLTTAQVAYIRDIVQPATLTHLSELRGRLIQFMREGVDETRMATDSLFGVENTLKLLRGRHTALVDPEFFGTLTGAEEDLRGRIQADPKLSAQVGDAYERIATAVTQQRNLYVRSTMLEGMRGFSGDLAGYARSLVRAAEERTKPNGERLREYSDARLPALRQRLANPAPVHPELEVVTLSFALEKLQELLGSDDPLVRQVLDRKSPLQRAEELVKNSTLGDPATRLKLFEGGQAAIDASTDPMIALMRLVDAEARAIRKKTEELGATIEVAQADIAKARFALFGDSIYPDATFSLRLSFGQVAGWTEPDGRVVDPYTTIAGLYDRATGNPPFDLAPSWLAAKDRVAMATPMNAVTTNDIIGGNSGSPALDRDGEVIGLVFDGNIHSLAGAFGYDVRRNRTVIVDVRGMIEALRSVYGADTLLQELGL